MCKIEGCENEVASRGWCGKHYTRWKRHGDPHYVTRDYSRRRYGLTEKERLRHNTEETADGCWEWQGYLLRGYGRFARTGGNPELVHRVSYELHKGPIPEGYEIDHTCGNRCCINPEHLDAVTRKEHFRRETRRRLDQWTTCKSGRHPYPENRITEQSTGRTRCKECQHEARARYKKRKANE